MTVHRLVMSPQAAAAEIEHQLDRAMSEADTDATYRAVQRLSDGARTYLAYGAFLHLMDNRKAAA